MIFGTQCYTGYVLFVSVPIANVYNIFFFAYIDIYTVCMCVLYKNVYSIIIDFKHNNFCFLSCPVLMCQQKKKSSHEKSQQ